MGTQIKSCKSCQQEQEDRRQFLEINAKINIKVCIIFQTLYERGDLIYLLTLIVIKILMDIYCKINIVIKI